MKSSRHFTKIAIIIFVILSLFSYILALVMADSKNALRGTIFQAKNSLHFQYALHVNSKDATIYFPEDYHSITVLDQKTVVNDGQTFLLVEGTFSYTADSTDMFWLCALDWYALLDQFTSSTTLQQFPSLEEDLGYQYANEELGFLLRTDQPVTDMSSTLDLSPPHFYVGGVRQLALLSVFEFLFILSILLFCRRKPYSAELARKFHELRVLLPTDIQSQGYKHYQTLYIRHTICLCSLRITLLLVLMYVQSYLLFLLVGSLVAVILSLIMAVCNVVLRIKQIKSIYNCQFNVVKAMFCSSLEPEFRVGFWDGFSSRGYGRDFGTLSSLALFLRFEGQPKQAIDLLDLCYQNLSRFQRTDSAQYYSLRCQICLDLGDQKQAKEAIHSLKTCLDQLKRVPLLERRHEQALRQQYMIMLAMMENRWSDALSMVSDLQHQVRAYPLTEVTGFALKYWVAKSLKEEKLSEDCLAFIQRYTPQYAVYLTKQ